MPPESVTTTFCGPAVPGGVTAVTVVAFTATTEVAAVPPIATAVADVNPVPVIVTEVPPLTGPESGVMLVIEHAGLIGVQT